MGEVFSAPVAAWAVRLYNIENTDHFRRDGFLWNVYRWMPLQNTLFSPVWPAHPRTGPLLFSAPKPTPGENGYLRDLWVLKDRDAPLRLTGDGKTGAFLWDSADTLLFTSSRSEEGKKKREAGEERTDFYRISLHGGEAEEAFSVPLSVTPLEKVREGVYLLQADWDMRYSKAYTLSGKAKEALLAEKKEDYHVLDELPFISTVRVSSTSGAPPCSSIMRTPVP